jgi:cyclase
MRHTSTQVPISDHFEIHPIAEGVYAATAIAGGAAFSNAGIIDLGDRTLIFDTFETPKAAQDLKLSAEQLTGRSASLVIISHAHDDHWLGNQVFADHADILSTHATRAAMILAGNDLLGLKDDPPELEELIREDEQRLKSEVYEEQRASLRNSIARWRHNLEMLPILQLRFPNQTFDGKFVIHGSQRSADLLTRGAGHTSSDCYLVLPEDRIAFMGDLAFFDCQPFMAQSDPQSWVTQLEEAEQSDIEIIVPGHGPVGGKAELATLREYILLLERLVAQVVKDGGTVEDAMQLSLPDPYGTWQRVGRARFESNVRSTFQRMTGR